MQLDMHYYATYALARAAGIKPGHAAEIAKAAQYVDVSDTAHIELRDGRFLACATTGHRPIDARNVSQQDLAYVLIPFHFLPGDDGRTVEQRLVCQMNSTLACEVVDHALNHAETEFGLTLLGVAAHVCADTFSHFGFSGFTSDSNSIEEVALNVRSAEILKYITEKANDFFEQRKHAAIDLLKLGHGGVAAYPDLPYLNWSFRYSDGRTSGERDNPTAYLAACEQLHCIFLRLAKAVPDYANASDTRPFHEIRGKITDILVAEGDLHQRISMWQTAASVGNLYREAAPIPMCRETQFIEELAELEEQSSDSAKGNHLYRFFQAATMHRDFVVRELLPRHDLPLLVGYGPLSEHCN